MTLRLGWAHPSVRDLVIEYLSDSPHERCRFLARASAGGLLLAISVSGGSEGEREYPLLRSQDDWEAFQGRLEQIMESGEPSDVHNLLTMLQNLPDRLGPVAHSIEADVSELIVRPGLSVIRARWEREELDVGVDELEAYVQASLNTRPLVSPPIFDHAWQHYCNRAKKQLEAGLEEPGAIDEIGGFVRMVILGRQADPRFLEQVGYPHSYRGFLHGLLVELRNVYDSFLPITEYDVNLTGDQDGIEAPSDEEAGERFWLEEAKGLCEELAGLGQYEDEFWELHETFSTAAFWREERSSEWESYVEDVGREYGEIRSTPSSGADFDIDVFFADL